MLERASMALIQIRSELQKAGTCVKLQLLLQCESGQQRIDVFLHCDNYSDVLAACAQVPYCCGSLDTWAHCLHMHSWMHV